MSEGYDYDRLGHGLCSTNFSLYICTFEEEKRDFVIRISCGQELLLGSKIFILFYSTLLPIIFFSFSCRLKSLLDLILFENFVTR